MTIDGNFAATYASYAFSEIAIIYPITPSSPMAELADEWRAAGKTNLFGDIPEVVEMQSESGAAGALHGAVTCGALAVTYTCSQGLLLMLPNMYKIAGELLPCVFHVSARALSTHALSIFGDHQDVMACRATGFAMLASASVQEAADLAIIAHVASLKASLPFLHFFDGFRTSHETQKVDVLEYDELKNLLPLQSLERFRKRALCPDNPIQRGTAQNPDVYFQNREGANKHYAALPDIVQETMDQLEKITKRAYHIFDYYGASDAESVIVIIGSGAQTVMETVEFLSKNGHKVGMVKVRLYRPFDGAKFCAALPKNCRRIAVLDRTKEAGSMGEPLYLDICAAVAEQGLFHLHVIGGRYGIGQKEFTPQMVASVFENLSSPHPKKHFTVGIQDDVTFLSLEPTPLSLPKHYTECKFFGLGSDGTVGANKNSIQIIGEHTDLYVQGYFEYDSKKSGGYTISHLRFGSSPIRAPYFVTDPDFIACHNPSYLHRYDILSRARTRGTFLLNCPWNTLESLNKRLPAPIKREIARKKLRFFVIDGTGIANSLGLNGKHSSVMQAAFFFLNEHLLPYEKALTILKETVTKKFAKKGEDVVQRNLLALDQTKDGITEIDYPTAWEDAEDDATDNDTASNFSATHPTPHNDKEAYFQEYISPILALKGDTLPVSAFSPDGSVPLGTSRLEKHGVAHSVPKWLPENCIQCNQCSFVCPHACIRPFLVNEATETPTEFVTLPAIGARGMRFRIQVSVHDCMGCELCARTCPAKEKALVMTKVSELNEKEGALWDFAQSLPPAPNGLFKVGSVKGSQFRQPLFEFSYACAGCGETPYIKLLTQLFGERLLIANATGCSSIYGGSSPTCPYAIAKNGKGPAWASSLFEDNAEFGLGMRLAYDNRPDSKEKSVWCIGGDGWAYDIGFGGLDHVLASGKNVNVLVLDSEVYSNTGGQLSKATPLGASARFAANGKRTRKKPLGLMMMQYENVYVAQVALGANMQQTLRAMLEAEAYDGPSVIIAYSPCIAHGVNMSKSLEEERLAVDCGYWHLFRFNPALEADRKNPFTLDSKEPTLPLEKFLLGENRFATLKNNATEDAERLFAEAEKDSRKLYQKYKKLADG